jgi:transcriptional regulator with XRE-family HTH domain
MPTAAPSLAPRYAEQLVAFGKQLRARRKQLKVTSTTAAEAAGMSRTTLHRIEQGEPSVTMGAYLGAAAALGLRFELVDPLAATRVDDLPQRLRVGDYAQLARLAWQLDAATEITARDAFDLYERNWRHVDVPALDAREREFVRTLAQRFGAGRLLV